MSTRAAAELLQQEAAFQAAADANGVAAAYRTFMDPVDGRHVRAGLPVRDADEAWRYYGGGRPGVTGMPGLFHSEVTEVWAARSGDWGVSLGRWRVVPPGKAGGPAEGSYTNTWRKNAHGEWKIIMNMGVLDGAPPSPPNSAKPTA